MRGRSVVKVRPQSRPAPAPMDSTNWVITLDVVTLWPLSAVLRAIAKIARAVPSLRRDSDWRIVRPAGAMPLPRDAIAVASVGPRQAPIRSAAPRESPRATPTPAIMPAVIMTRTVADRMMPRSARFMRTSETDRDSQYRRNGRKIVRTIVGGEGRFGRARDERGPRARCDEEYRADQVESVGQEDAAHSGDSEDDDCFDGHGSPFGWDSPLTVRRYCARVCTGGVACGTCGNRWVG